MALDLHIAGPGLDVSRRLAAGDPALILGRDADCSVCLIYLYVIERVFHYTLQPATSRRP